MEAKAKRQRALPGEKKDVFQQLLASTCVSTCVSTYGSIYNVPAIFLCFSHCVMFLNER